jgi:hypothetical protein
MFSEATDLDDVITYRNATRPHPSFWGAFQLRSFSRNAEKEVKRLLVLHAKPSGVSRSANIPDSGGRNVTVYFAYPSPRLSGLDFSALDETASTIAVAHRLCAAQGARFIFVFVPTKFRVFRDYCQFPQESECRDWTVNDLPTRLKTALASVSPDIEYLDLTPKLAQSVKNGVLPYYPDDDHWSPEGHKIAADAINDYLESTQTRQDPQLVANHE